ncbi:unnamed protein product [Lepeophtheirus salmonis]|uniref:(salmon louse) hypothetical protein n=1 Tax=Lepeophtheirus salmonis TaxID=72036 RepID=A0A7R8D8H7_LEPSM|nr:unnamed protein product [Lepeophtheirus salmonis]CAF3008775.1 unnamed protein product [Lepeophtheirus salmonis]
MNSKLSCLILLGCAVASLVEADDVKKRDIPTHNRPYIKILSSSYNAPGTLDGSSNFDYAFLICGPDGQTYVVDWYADETGYHPSAPHLPKDVPIPYPEIADAVAAQISFAAANPNDYDNGSYNGNSINNIVYDDRPITNYGYNK